jgi:hypothetical protein
VEWSRASYGPYFDAQQGGVFAMKWDEDGIGVCLSIPFFFSFLFRSCFFVGSFYRAAIPQDILSGAPDPSNWGVPVAFLDPSQCDPSKYFVNHSLIFGKCPFVFCASSFSPSFSLKDITFCGMVDSSLFFFFFGSSFFALGDWAGNSYATSGCPGTCNDRLMDPSNFVVGFSSLVLVF